MIKYVLPFSLLFSIIFLYSCQQNQETREEAVRVINLDEAPSIEIDIAAMTAEPIAIPLQTSDSILVSQFSNYFLTGQYILVYDQDQLLQFDRNGRYIRKLSQSGGGPFEFQYIQGLDMSDDERYLYLKHYGTSKSMIRFDLETGKPGLIDVPYNPQSFLIENDEIYGFSMRENYVFFRSDLEGNILDTLKNTIDASGRADVMVKDGKPYFLFDSDTLYQFVNRSFVPELVYKFDEKFDREKVNPGFVTNVGFHSNGYYYPELMLREESNVNGSSSVTIGREWKFYQVADDGSSVHQIDTVRLGYLDIGFYNYDPSVYKNELIFDIQPMQWLEAVDNLENPTPLQQQLIESTQNVGFEDNPVLLITKLK